MLLGALARRKDAERAFMLYRLMLVTGLRIGEALRLNAEAAGAGFYDSPWGTRHPRLQVLTVAELLAGKRIDMPPIRQVGATFKKAERFKAEGGKQLKIEETGKG